ncbi:MAG: glycosyltransferase, partial [Polyangiaceae bacterium]
MTPAVTVAVAFHANVETIGACLRSLVAQRGAPPFEVVAIDNCSRDGSRAVAASFAGVRIVHESIPGIGSARGAALRAARAPLLAFLDADCVAPPEWLGRLFAAILADPTAAALGGALRNASPRHLVAHALHLFEFGEQLPRRCAPRATPNAVPANIIYRRAALEEAGGFEPRLVFAEDTLLHGRLLARGLRVVLDPTIEVSHA